jgi:hypothetical protein
MLPDWRALVISMNLSPVVVKVRPAWRRLGYRFGRHPLPVPQLAPAGITVLPEEVPEPAPASAEAPAPVLASVNGHGGKPGPLVKAGSE